MTTMMEFSTSVPSPVRCPSCDTCLSTGAPGGKWRCSCGAVLRVHARVLALEGGPEACSAARGRTEPHEGR